VCSNAMMQCQTTRWFDTWIKKTEKKKRIMKYRILFVGVEIEKTDWRKYFTRQEYFTRRSPSRDTIILGSMSICLFFVCIALNIYKIYPFLWERYSKMFSINLPVEFKVRFFTLRMCLVFWFHPFYFSLIYWIASK